MIIKKISNGYASELYKVTAEKNECLTKEMVEEKFAFPFGCTVMRSGDDFIVECYTD